MQSKTNRKNPDRIILLEVGLILSLLFVNWALNLQYRADPICIFDPPESLLYDPASVSSTHLTLPTKNTSQ